MAILFYYYVSATHNFLKALQNNINLSAKFEIMENCDVVFYNVSSGLAAMDQLRDKIDPSPNDKPEVTFKEIPILAEAFERYRWPTTMALQGILHFINLQYPKGAHKIRKHVISPSTNNIFYLKFQEYLRFFAYSSSLARLYIIVVFLSCSVFLACSL